MPGEGRILENVIPLPGDIVDCLGEVPSISLCGRHISSCSSVLFSVPWRLLGHAD